MIDLEAIRARNEFNKRRNARTVPESWADIDALLAEVSTLTASLQVSDAAGRQATDEVRTLRAEVERLAPVVHALSVACRRVAIPRAFAPVDMPSVLADEIERLRAPTVVTLVCKKHGRITTACECLKDLMQIEMGSGPLLPDWNPTRTGPALAWCIECKGVNHDDAICAAQRDTRKRNLAAKIRHFNGSGEK